MKENESRTPPSPIRLAIIDDHPVFRQGLQNIFATEDDVEIVGAGGSGEEALDLVEALHPDVLLLDINLPGINGLQVTNRLKAAHSPTAIVLLTGSSPWM